MNDNLPELRDIHLPESVSAWPPAYGWFVILVALGVIYGSIKLYGLWKRKSKKIYTLRALENLDKTHPLASATKISELLRRVCILRYPEAVALDGADWLAFLEKNGKEKLSENAAALLRYAPYENPKTQTYSQENLQELTKFAQNWVGENL